MIKGTRIPIYLILDLLAAGYKSKDIVAAIEYASGILKREEVVEVKA